MRSLIQPGRRLLRPTEADIALARLSTDGGAESFARRRFLQGALATGGAVGMMPGLAAWTALIAACTFYIVSNTGRIKWWVVSALAIRRFV